MATGTIKGRALETGTISRIYTTNGTFEQYQCYKIGNIVCMGCRIYGMSGSGATGVAQYFQLPSGFIPRAETTIFCTIQLSNASIVLSTAKINTDGKISATYGSGTIQQIVVTGTFPV